MSAVAILHPSGLLGKELRETLEARHPEWDLRLLSSREDEIGTLTEIAGAAALVGRFEPESLAGVSLAFFCAEMADNRPLLAGLPAETTAIVLSYDAAVEDGQPVVAGVNTADAHGRRVLLSPHPGVVLLAHLLHPLRPLALAEAVATLIQPASMRDDAGLEELFEQTRRIVAMTGRGAAPVFGAQLSFNVLPAPPPWWDASSRRAWRALPSPSSAARWRTTGRCSPRCRRRPPPSCSPTTPRWRTGCRSSPGSTPPTPTAAACCSRRTPAS
ncbi:MAG TPA: hypothetical protein VIC28_11340, partial [Thermoanaerobaculia bacterium]